MLNITAKLDSDADHSFLGIEAHGTLPEIASELEILIRQIIHGMVLQLPNERADAARAILSIAAINGATRHAPE